MKLICLLAAVALTSMCSIAASAGPPPGISVSLVPDRATVMVGEPVYATFRIRNAGPTAVSIHIEWLARNSLGRPESFQVSAQSTKGAAVPVPALRGSFGGRSWRVEIAPGADHDLRLFLPNWTPFTEPGTYTVTAVTSMEFGDPKTATRHDLRASATVKVTAPDSARMGKIITRDAAAMASGDDEAARRMMHIHDARVIPHFLAELAAPNYSRKFRAIQVLGKWNTDDAVAGLERASRTSAAELDPEGFTRETLRVESAAQLRVAAAYALAESPHPRSSQLLLAMRSDRYASVRLIVAQNAVKADPAGHRKLLRAFTKDPDPRVASEATRLLNQQGGPGAR